MKPFLLQLFFILFATTLFGQTTFEDNFSTVWCSCFDSIDNHKLNEETFSKCFQTAFFKNSNEVVEETKKRFGDTSDESGYKFGLELYNKISVSSIKSCNSYYHFMDTLRFTDFKNLNKDSIKSAIKIFNDTSQTKGNDFYTQRGLLYFQINDLDKALHDFDNALTINPNSVQSIYLKALTFELKNNYDEAIILYGKLFTLTQKNDFKVLEAIVERKKSGL